MALQNLDFRISTFVVCQVSTTLTYMNVSLRCVFYSSLWLTVLHLNKRLLSSYKRILRITWSEQVCNVKSIRIREINKKPCKSSKKMKHEYIRRVMWAEIYLFSAHISMKNPRKAKYRKAKNILARNFRVWFGSIGCQQNPHSHDFFRSIMDTEEEEGWLDLGYIYI